MKSPTPGSMYTYIFLQKFLVDRGLNSQRTAHNLQVSNEESTPRGVISSCISFYVQKLQYLNFMQCLHQFISQTYMNSRNIVKSMLDTWKCGCISIFKKLKIESNNNVKSNLQTLMPSLWLLILRVSKAFVWLITLCVDFPLISLKTKMFYLCQNITVVGYQGVYLQIFCQPHCSQVTTHCSLLTAHRSHVSTPP